MNEKLNKLYKDIEYILDHAPDEDSCTNEENDMYADMTNLLWSMKSAGYGF